MIVRPPSGESDATAKRYPAIEFVVDDGNQLRSQVGLTDGGGPFGSLERATIVVEADGTVCATVSNSVEASAHAAYALRLIRELDATAVAEQAAGQPSVDDLRDMVMASATPTQEEVEADEQRERRRSAAALRAQAMRAEVNRNVKFSFGRKTLEAEAQRLARKAVDALDKARTEESECRAARARAEAAGDTALAERYLVDAADAAERASRAREDEIAALQIEADAIVEKLGGMRMTIESEDIRAKEAARRAYGYRRIATAAAISLSEAGERAQMRDALSAWARRQQTDQDLADDYRTAVESAWAQTQQGGQAAQETAAVEAERWAERLSSMDPTELQQAKAEAPAFDTVAQAVTYNSASAAIRKAEQEEEEAQKRAAQLEATMQRKARAEEQLEVLEVRMGKKAAVDERAKRDAADEESNEMRAALEVAMFRSEASADDGPDANADEMVAPPAASDAQQQKIAELERRIADLKGSSPESES